MRLRLGLGIGFATGYYLGAKAGRERYETMNGWIAKVRSSETFTTATDTAREAVDVTVDKAKDRVDDIKTASHGNDPADLVTINEAKARS